MMRDCIAMFVFCFVICSVFAGEQEIEQVLPELKNVVVAGPYCGVYSLLASLYSFGIVAEQEDLLKPEYVGSIRGSSSEELIKAAEHYGLYGKCYGNVSWKQLDSIKESMILHFRGNGDQEFNHWVAFLGMEGNHVRIIDYPHELAYLAIAELLTQWDGIAVLLSKEPINNALQQKTQFDFLFVILFVLGSGLLYKTCFYKAKNEPAASNSFQEWSKRIVIHTLSIVAVCGFAAVAYHALSPIGFLKNPSAVAEVTRRCYAVDVPEISLAEMKQIAEQKDAVIYDARYHKDFEYGAIPGAISLPINSDLSERKQILQGVDKGKKIVLYCQSSGCPFSDNVASFLKFNGYRNISIFRGGYREWEKMQKQSAKLSIKL